MSPSTSTEYLTGQGQNTKVISLSYKSLFYLRSFYISVSFNANDSFFVIRFINDVHLDVEMTLKHERKLEVETTLEIMEENLECETFAAKKIIWENPPF